MKTHWRTALPEGINKLVGDINLIFENSKHKLLIVAKHPIELELIRSDFGHLPFIDLGLSENNLLEPPNTKQMYYNLKGNTAISDLYWENDLKEELQDFRSTIEGLERLSALYRQYLSDSQLGYQPELTFVLSKPASPLMVIYSGTKAMMYNFSGQA